MADNHGDVAYLECLEAQEVLYWEARRRGWPLDDKAVGDILRLVAPILRGKTILATDCAANPEQP